MTAHPPPRRRWTVHAAVQILPRIALFRELARADGLFWPFLRYSAALWRQTSLHPCTRELVILRVAAAENCDYELAQHLPIARRTGLTESAIATALRRPLPEPPGPEDALKPAQRAVLLIADAVLSSDGSMSAGRGAQPPSRTTLETALLAGHYLTIARLTHLLALPPDTPAAPLSRSQAAPEALSGRRGALLCGVPQEVRRLGRPSATQAGRLLGRRRRRWRWSWPTPDGPRLRDLPYWCGACRVRRG